MDLRDKRFLFASEALHTAGGRVCMQGLPNALKKKGYDVTINDWSDYTKYDFVFFMGPDSQVLKAKQQNPRAKVGIMDPKIGNASGLGSVRAADFLLVSSIEQREFFLQYNPNIVIYYMFPETPESHKTHAKKEKIVLGYHGNKLHLHNFEPSITQALINLSKRHEIELIAVYNVEKLKRWKTELERHITVRHVQWSEEGVVEALKECDIGLVPNLVHQTRSTSSWLSRLRHALRPCVYACRTHDYVHRYKYSTNPGRLYVFSQLGIPILSDFTPSSAHFLQDGLNGGVVNGTKGWERGIETLIQSPELRQTYADNLRNYISSHYSIEANADTLLTFLTRLSSTL